MSSRTSLQRRVFYGSAVHSVSLTQLEYLESTLIGVDEAGVIAFIERDVAKDRIGAKLTEKGWQGVELVELSRGDFLCPGLIDTHTHAPQYVNLAYGQQYELLDWLKKVTFPAEEKYKSAAYARRTYEGVVQRIINAGTTTVCYYGTLHLTTQILAAICHRKGQRAFVGKCNMDRLSADDYQEPSAAQSLRDTETFISFVRSNCADPTRVTKNNGTVTEEIASVTRKGYRTDLVHPIITPRFAIACSDELLQGLGEMLQKDPSLPCQTHLSENPTEIEFTQSLFPFASSYTAVYDHFNLLQENTVLAHCVHLDDSEMALIKAKQAGVSHCPNSNFNLRSGTTRVTTLLDRGIKLSLGTDVAGGTSLGLLSAIRTASFASKSIVFNSRDAHASIPPPPEDAPKSAVSGYPENYFASRHLSVETLFYLATIGGAQVCCLDDRVGNFVVGKEFDALLIQSGQRTRSEMEEGQVEDEALKALSEEIEHDFPSEADYGPGMFTEPEDGLEKLFEKFLFSGDDRNIASVFVRGRVIGGARPLA